MDGGKADRRIRRRAAPAVPVLYGRQAACRGRFSGDDGQGVACPGKFQGRERDENMAVSYCRQYLSGYAPKRMVQDAEKERAAGCHAGIGAAGGRACAGDCRRRAEPAGKIPRGHGAVL